MPVTLEEVEASVAARGATWTPQTTTNSHHSPAHARRRTGAVPPAGYEQTLRRPAVRPAGHGTGLAPSAHDWRSVGGQSYVTPIRNQRNCGSCVAFGSIAVVESMARIESAQPGLPIDLSETDLFNGYGKDHNAGACPGGGWWPDDAWPGLVAGIVDESCAPYDDADQLDIRCADAGARMTRVNHLTHIGDRDIEAMKSYISTTGPMSVCFKVFEDFYYFYGGGVYAYDEAHAGDFVGWHCAAVVGYRDSGTDRYWILKNSWGAGWGDHGFFYLHMGDQALGHDQQMWGAVGVSSFLLQHSTMHALGLSAGNVWHTLRHPDGRWDAFAHVHGPNNEGQPPFLALDAGGVGDDLHVTGLIAGNVWHTIRHSDGSWQSGFGHVHGPNNEGVGDFSRISCDGVRDQLHLVGLIKGNVWHTIRHSDGSWQSGFGHVHGPNNEGRGDFTDVACAGVGDQLHVVGVIAGRLWHTIRFPNGSWQSGWGQLGGGNPGSFTQVGCAGVGSDLHVVGNAGGRLWHTIRHADGSWQGSLGDVMAVHHNNPGSVATFGCAAVGNTLHLLLSINGVPWHTIRFADGSWQSTFGEVPHAGAPALGMVRNAGA